MADLKLATRTFTKTPFITAVAVLSLALGIGANAAIYSLFDQMLLRSLPVQNPDQLVNLRAPGPQPGSQSCNQAGGCDATFSYLMFRDLEKADGPFSGVAAHRLFGANLAFEGHTLSATGLLVSGSYFPVLGVRPAMGRVFGVSDDQTIGESPVAVLSYNYWENRLGKDPTVLNRTLIVNGHPMTVVGVAAQGFTGTTLGTEPDIFVPLSMRAQMEPWFVGQFDNRRSYWAYVFARLKPGETIERATQQINTTYSGIINEVEAPLQEGMSDFHHGALQGEEASPRAWCPGAEQPPSRGEDAPDHALQHHRTRAPHRVRQHRQPPVGQGSRPQPGDGHPQLPGGESEGTSWASCSPSRSCWGSWAAWRASWWRGGRCKLIGILIPADALGSLTLTLNFRVIAFSGVLALGTGLLFGLFPALHASRTDLVTVLKSNSGQPSGAKAAARFRTSLVTAQISLSMALLVAAGLFIKSLVNVSKVDLGLDTSHMVVFGLSPVLNGYKRAGEPGALPAGRDRACGHPRGHQRLHGAGAGSGGQLLGQRRGGAGFPGRPRRGSGLALQRGGAPLLQHAGHAPPRGAGVRRVRRGGLPQGRRRQRDVRQEVRAGSPSGRGQVHVPEPERHRRRAWTSRSSAWCRTPSTTT